MQLDKRAAHEKFQPAFHRIYLMCHIEQRNSRYAKELYTVCELYYYHKQFEIFMGIWKVNKFGDGVAERTCHF
jgi:hypothetical protein